MWQENRAESLGEVRERDRGSLDEPPLITYRVKKRQCLLSSVLRVGG
jgi:hypothetical protein